jgi:nucleotide-binding universal stress UspA family protein
METIAYKKIMVATDYTASSQNAVNTAVAICRKQDAGLVLLHVVKDATDFTPAEDFNPGLDYIRQMKSAATGELRNLVERIRDESGLRAEGIVAYGEVVKEIIRNIREAGPDLVILGTHGASGFRSFFMGSTAYRVIKHTKFPVLTVPESGDWTTFRSILFPIRLIPDALKKYDHIRPIVRKDNPFLYITGLSMESDPESVKGVFDLEDELETRLNKDQVRFDVSFHRCRNYADRILESADEKKADLIVIIATIDKTQGEFFIGPFSQQILNHAKVPVLCVRT